MNEWWVGGWVDDGGDRWVDGGGWWVVGEK